LKYNSEDYFSVINTKTGKKICDCADEYDALMMVSFDLQNRTITKNKFLMGPVVDIEIPKQLPTNEVVLVRDEREDLKSLKQHQNKLPQNELEPLKF
jgi:hypothetical protein